MAASQASRYGARLAGAAVGGAIAVKAFDGDLQLPSPEERVHPTPEEQQQQLGRRRRRRRPGLLQYVHVEVKGSLPEELARPSWLPLPPAPPAAGGVDEEAQEEAAAAPSSDKQPPPLRPLVFVTGADACLIDNLVDDILQSGGGGGGGSRVRVSFLPESSAEKGRGKWMLRAEEAGDGDGDGLTMASAEGDNGLLLRLWEGLGLLGRPSVEPSPHQQQQIFADVEGLLSSLSPSSSPNGEMVVLDVTPLTVARPGTEEGQEAGATLRRLFRWARGAGGIIFTAASPLGLWKSQLLATGKGALPSPDGGGAGEVEGGEAEEGNAEEGGGEGEGEGGQALEGVPVLHVQVRGINEALLGLLVSESAAAAAAAESPQQPATPALSEHGAPDGANADGAEPAQLEEEQEEAHEEDGALVSGPASQDAATDDVELWPSLLRLGPRLDVLLDTLPPPSSSTGGGSVAAAVEGEKARLLAALLGGGDESVLPGVLLWDVLSALHGERLDVVTGTRLGLGRPGTLPLETLIHLCSDEPDLLGKLEALMGDGWLAVHDPALAGDDAVAAPAPGDAKAGAEEQEPQPQQSSAPMILCAASLASLGSVGLPFSKATLITTPALPTLAWRAVHGDPAVAATMRARSDARHVAQHAGVLRGQRLALQAEWTHLYEARRALAERREELSAGDLASLQLELIRLERAAASRAYEMRGRARNLAELRERLEEALPRGQAPSAAMLAAPNAHAGDPSLPPLSIEERVLLDVDRGLRGVPVEVEWHAGGRGQEEEEGTEEEAGKGKGRGGWWARVKGWRAWVSPSAWRGRAGKDG